MSSLLADRRQAATPGREQMGAGVYRGGMRKRPARRFGAALAGRFTAPPGAALPRS